MTRKVLVVSQYFWPESFRVNELVEKLIARGYQVDVITGVPNYPGGAIFKDYRDNPENYKTYKNARVHRIKMWPRGNSKLSLIANYLSFMVSCSFFLVFKYRKKDYDAVLAVQLSPVLSVVPALLYGKKQKIKVLTWVLDLWPDSVVAVDGAKNKLILGALSSISSWIYKSSDKVLITSKGFKNRLKSLGVNESKIVYFPQWVEDSTREEFDSEGLAYKNIRDLLMPYEDKLKIIFTGNLGEAQDLVSVINGISLNSQRDKFVLLLVGDGRARESIEQLISNLSLNDSVVMLGQFPSEVMPMFYFNSDALLVSLADEPLFALTLPGKVQNYLQAGRPIIGMINGEGATVLRESGSAIVVPAGDCNKFSTAIDELLDADPLTLEKKGLAATAYAQKHYQSKVLVDRLVAIIEDDQLTH